MRDLFLVLGTVAFAALHVAWYARVVALRLWELSGGVRTEGRLTGYGLTDWAWTVPANVPAGAFVAAGLGPLGLPLILAGSLAAGFAAASLLVGLHDRPAFGRRGWRVWLFAAGWGWVPVPATASWVYQWTVAY